MSDTFDLALAAIAAGIFGGTVFVLGYYLGRKDRIPGDRK